MEGISEAVDGMVVKYPPHRIGSITYNREKANVDEFSLVLGPVFVFNRPLWKEPTKNQLVKYDLDKKIVESHEGQMIKMQYQIGGNTSPFSKKDCEVMKKQIKLAVPKVKIIDSWNGEGCYSFSVSVVLPKTEMG